MFIRHQLCICIRNFMSQITFCSRKIVRSFTTTISTLQILSHFMIPSSWWIYVSFMGMRFSCCNKVNMEICMNHQQLNVSSLPAASLIAQDGSLSKKLDSPPMTFSRMNQHRSYINSSWSLRTNQITSPTPSHLSIYLHTVSIYASAISGCYSLREFLILDDFRVLLLPRTEEMLAVLKSLRNSGKLIFPSLSMSASSKSGSMEPFSPVCYNKQYIQPQ